MSHHRLQWWDLLLPAREVGLWSLEVLMAALKSDSTSTLLQTLEMRSQVPPSSGIAGISISSYPAVTDRVPAPRDAGKAPLCGPGDLRNLASASFPTSLSSGFGVLPQPSLSGQVTLGNRVAYCHQSDWGLNQTPLTDLDIQGDTIRQDEWSKDAPPPDRPSHACSSGCPCLPLTLHPASWHCSPGPSTSRVGKCSSSWQGWSALSPRESAPTSILPRPQRSL